MITTKEKARKEAVRILGKDAMIFQGRCEKRVHRTGRKTCSAPDAHGNRCPGSRPFVQVGFSALGSFFVRGAGRTWEKAFARARHKIHLDSCQKWWVRKKCVRCTTLSKKAI